MSHCFETLLPEYPRQHENIHIHGTGNVSRKQPPETAVKKKGTKLRTKNTQKSDNIARHNKES